MMAQHRGDIERRERDAGHHHQRLLVLMVRTYVGTCVQLVCQPRRGRRGARPRRHGATPLAISILRNSLF
jgi:hypothetical protein